jgi:hypothetical protein
MGWFSNNKSDRANGEDELNARDAQRARNQDIDRYETRAWVKRRVANELPRTNSRVDTLLNDAATADRQARKVRRGN